MKVGLIYIHGWSFDGYFWNRISQKLSNDFLSYYFDSNYFKNKKRENFLDLNINSSIISSRKWVVICHSYGLLRFIRSFSRNIELQKNVIGIVSIAGFIAFTKSSNNPYGIDTLILHKMVKKFNQDPFCVLQDFRQNCSFSSQYYKHKRNIIHQDLLDDLRDLLLVSEENDAKKITQPILILAADDDRIVSKNITCSLKEVFPNSIPVTRKNGGHALGFNHASWCVKKIKKFIKGLDFNG